MRRAGASGEHRPQHGRADRIESRVAANALMGVHRALVDFARQRILDGSRPPRLGREVRAQAERAFALLEEGLGSEPITRAAARS